MPTIEFARFSQMGRLLLTATVAAALNVAPLAAQPIADSARVRIAPLSRTNSSYSGRFVKATADTIWFVPKRASVPYAFPMNNVLTLQQSTDYKPRFWRAAVGAGAGMVVIAAAGMLYLKTSGNACECEADGIGVVLAVHLIGAPIGAALGASRGGKQWRNVSLPLTVGVGPARRGQRKLALIRF